MTKILVMNTSFKNRGDSLMIEAISNRLSKGNELSIAADIAVSSPRESRAYRTCLISSLPRSSPKQRIFNTAIAVGSHLGSKLPLPGITTPEDIDIALDVSGYCFGDPWGMEKLDSLCRAYHRLKRAGAKVVLMPKTWGPFKKFDPRLIDGMLDSTDLVFVRDEQSMINLTQVVSTINTPKIRFAPDYTHEVSAPAPSGLAGEKLVFIIPSSRVIDSGTFGAEEYMQLLSLARSHVSEIGYRPKLLIHESSNDLKFVDQADKMGFRSTDIEVPVNALATKSLVSTAEMIVTSRLHGLYNALNSCIPVAVLGWSFKYREALAQYGVSECLVDISNPIESLREKIDMLADPILSHELKAKMAVGKSRSRSGSEAMWDEIERLIANQENEREN